MFEDSLVESRIHHIPSSKQWTTLASISLQFAIMAAIITLPLLHPETLPFRVDAPKILLPLPPKPPEPVVRTERTPSASSSTALPTVSRPLLMPSLLPNSTVAANDAPPLSPIGSGMGSPDGLPAGIGDNSAGHGPAVSIAPTQTPTGPVHVSSGVSQGMLLTPIRPVYPAIAKAAHVSGSVVVEATISQTGTIESLHILSGPVMLQSAAIEAIRAARYQPYRLNGQPTAVQTTITVNFRMEG
jgi:protein TonB